MNHRERIRTIISGEAADRCGLWLGHPKPETAQACCEHFGVENFEEVRKILGDDFRWIPANGAYQGPCERPMFPLGERKSHGHPGPFHAASSRADIAAYDWPDLDDLNFKPILERLDQAGDVYRASGFWTPFYHELMNLFGMETYLMNMYMNPDVVHEATEHVCGFYLDANRRFFEAAGDRIDAFFFGNDFGTQLDLICGLEPFDRFIMPWFRRFTDLAHEFDLQVILHSCGSIYRVIERLIEAGVECLHPLQARAKNMEAERLAEEFKGRIAFMGGIDTQDLLVNASPDEVAADVRRVKDLLGPCLIVSPSHEAILPNVSPANIEAMARAAVE